MAEHEQPHGYVTHACGHTVMVWFIGETDYELVNERVECEGDICTPCLAKVQAQGWDAVEAHWREVKARRLARAA